MPINASKARSLCTASEYNLFKWSSAKMSKTLAPSQLRQKIDRARKLRDKYRDLAKQQRGEARGKRNPTGTRAAKGNERTVEKAQLFAEVLERLQSALTSAESKQSTTKKTAGKKTAKKKTAVRKTTRKKTSKKPAAKKAASAGEASKKKSVTKRGKKAVDAGTKKQSPPRTGAKPAIPLASGATRVTTPSLSDDGGGHASPFTNLTEELGKSDISARRTRRRQASKDAREGRIENRFARTAQEKIQGHVSGQTKRHQARRDANG